MANPDERRQALQYELDGYLAVGDKDRASQVQDVLDALATGRKARTETVRVEVPEIETPAPAPTETPEPAPVETPAPAPVETPERKRPPRRRTPKRPAAKKPAAKKAPAKKPAAK